MKLIAVITSMLITGGIFFTPASRTIKGTWLIETGSDECGANVLRVQMHQGIWKGLIDYPKERKYDQRVMSLSTQSDSIDIILNIHDRIVGYWVNDRLIKGTKISGGLREAVELIKQ